MSIVGTTIYRRAVFSECGKYRYRIFRTWDISKNGVLFILLNPSTADENKDDPTVRRCMGFAYKWGYGWLEIRNLFALRSTNPKMLYKSNDPIGPDNSLFYDDDQFDKIVLAWGNHGKLKGRGDAVMKMMVDRGQPAYYFSLTKTYQPIHPLYVGYDVELTRLGLM